MFQGIFLTIYARSENWGTERSAEQPGVHRPQSSSINFEAPNKISILEFKSGIDLIIEISPGIIKLQCQHGYENNFVYSK